MDKDSLPLTLVDSATATDLSILDKYPLDAIWDNISDYGEVAKDLSEAIPILKACYALHKGVRKFRDVFFEKKIIKFLEGLEKGRKSDKCVISDELQNEKERVRFGETILHILDRSEDTRKAELIGYIWAACQNGEISYTDAKRVTFMVDRAYWNDLAFLIHMKEGTQGENEAIADSLFGVGLLENKGVDGGLISNPASGGTIYGTNRYGSIVLDYGLKRMQPFN